MKMWRAIARTRAARMTAESDGLALLIAAVGIAAVAAFQLDQGEMPQFDRHTAQLDRLDLLEHRCRRPGKRSRLEIAGPRHSDVAQICRLGGHRRFAALVRRQPQAPGAPERGTAGVRRVEPRIDRLRGLRIGHAFGNKFPQRVRVLGRPVRQFHLVVLALVNAARRRAINF